jgi:hypothetical protein
MHNRNGTAHAPLLLNLWRTLLLLRLLLLCRGSKGRTCAQRNGLPLCCCG